MGCRQQRIDEVQARLDRDDHARFEHAGQPQMGMSFRSLTLLPLGVGEHAADVVDLQAQQVPDAMRKEHARKPKLDGRLSTDREQPCAMQDVAQNAVRSQMDGAIVAARDDLIAQQ